MIIDSEWATSVDRRLTRVERWLILITAMLSPEIFRFMFG